MIIFARQLDKTDRIFLRIHGRNWHRSYIREVLKYKALEVEIGETNKKQPPW